MDRRTVLDRLHAELPTLRTRFDVERLSIFGSVARDEADESSDVDVLVEFKHQATFRNFMGLKLHLEDIFGTRVDLATPNSLKPRYFDRITREAVHVS